MSKAVSSRFLDFWLLGGASILVFLVMAGGSFLRDDSQLVQQKFIMLAPVFGLFSIFCNNPHFIVSYRFGYSRGYSFLLKYWVSLVLVPVALLALYVSAYFYFDADVSQTAFVVALNRGFETVGIGYRFGQAASFGRELLGLSIWIMYFTVGWHYAKQVYGCMMVYSRFDGFTLSKNEKLLIRYSLLALALFQFLYASGLSDQFSASGYEDPRFAGIHLLSLGLPAWLLQASSVLAFAFFVAVVGLLGRKFLKEKKTPSVIFIVAWLSLYVWWVQVLNLPEFYYLAVPFFHSLQYLPFAYKMESKNIPANRWTLTQISLRVIGFFILGFLFFELIPQTLDNRLETEIAKTTWFFVTSFAVFINVHHFFIDSVVWRLEQPQVKSGLF